MPGGPLFFVIVAATFTTFFIHKSTLFALLLINEFIIDTIIQVSIIVLFIDTILFTAFGAEFYGSARYKHICDFFWPDKRWIVVFSFFYLLVTLVDEHRLDRVEWS